MSEEPLPQGSGDDTVGSSDAAVSKTVREAFEKAPEPGKGRRWYDFPYRVFEWLLLSWRLKVLPRATRSALNRLLNHLLIFDTHERNKVWSREDPHHNLFVPKDEHVVIPALWVVELFPPSESQSLARAIDKNSWGGQPFETVASEGNIEILQRSRGGSGWTSWSLATVADTKSKFYYPGVARQKLPAPFSAVELTALQIGRGLTAVVAYFVLTDEASSQIDSVWHAQHEPRLVRSKGRLVPEDRHWAALHVTQQSRQDVHDSARAWLAAKCPGFFAARNESQPSLDLLLFERHNPLVDADCDHKFSDALRALGLTEDAVWHRSSPQLPNLLLSPVHEQLCRRLDPRTSALWGSREAVANGLEERLRLRGGDSDRAVAHALNDRLRNFVVMEAVSEFLRSVEQRYAVLRDNARVRHGEFKPHELRALRASLLTLSLDLTSVARDVEEFWKHRWRVGGLQFILDRAPKTVRRDEQVGRKRFKPVDLTRELRETHKQYFRELIASDLNYRDILSTVASLGASADAFKVSRVAIWISLVSLMVALSSLLLADVGADSALSEAWAWLRRLNGSD